MWIIASACCGELNLRQSDHVDTGLPKSWCFATLDHCSLNRMRYPALALLGFSLVKRSDFKFFLTRPQVCYYKIKALLLAIPATLLQACLKTINHTLPTPCSGSTFHSPFQLTRHPSAIEVACRRSARRSFLAISLSEIDGRRTLLTFLRRHLLPINEAIPRHTRSIDAQVAFDVLERFRGLFVAPDLTTDALVR